jgi:hypothetical protein
VTATPDSPAGRVSIGEISDLIAWMRRLSDAGIHRVDPAELAAFHAAKHDLLARIAQPSHRCDDAPDQARGHDEHGEQPTGGRRDH